MISIRRELNLEVHAGRQGALSHSDNFGIAGGHVVDDQHAIGSFRRTDQNWRGRPTNPSQPAMCRLASLPLERLLELGGVGRRAQLNPDVNFRARDKPLVRDPDRVQFARVDELQHPFATDA